MPVPKRPPASIVIPTRNRPSYLEVALESIAPQAQAVGAEVLVVDDAGATTAGQAQAQRFGARYEPHERPLGLNVARNTGVERSEGELVVFVDDDIAATPGWLQALLHAAREHPDVDVFAGTIRARLEGPGGWASHSCGRERPPITTLQLGPDDIDTRYAWGSNMAIRRAALRRVGPFDVRLAHGGDEQEWQERLRAREPGARILYVAGAAVDHRRAGPDARLRALVRAQYTRGRAARRFDTWRGAAPSRTRELATLGGCAWHVVRHGCPAGLTMVAHSAGRLREAVASEPTSKGAAIDTDDFLSGHSGTVGGANGALRTLRDEAIDAWEIASTKRLRLDRAARHAPPRRRVLAIGVVRPEHARRAQRIRAELMRSRHEVELLTCAPGELGKFENLNRLLAEQAEQAGVAKQMNGTEHADRIERADEIRRADELPIPGCDWLLVIDDDVDLPRGFLDRLLFLSERFSLQLAQPAHRLDSHAAWEVTRRRPGSIVRETGFVEIGPVTALAGQTFARLLPFPPQLRMGWGLDAHWAALTREHGWRCGVVDAVAIGHRAAPAAGAYSREAAVAEARAYLAQRPYVRASELQRTLTTHHRW